MSSWNSNYFGNIMLQTQVVGIKTWLALHLGDPGVNATIATEMTGGGYARQSTTWSVPNNKTIATTNSQIFHDLPTFTITHLGVWDAYSYGHLLFRLPLSTPINVSTANYFTALPGDVAYSL